VTEPGGGDVVVNVQAGQEMIAGVTQNVHAPHDGPILEFPSRSVVRVANARKRFMNAALVQHL
jgi:hypothetical protein